MAREQRPLWQPYVGSGRALGSLNVGERYFNQ